MTATEELLRTRQYDYYHEQAYGSEDQHVYSHLSTQRPMGHAHQPLIDNETKWCLQHDVSQTDVAGLRGSSFIMEPLGRDDTQALGQRNQACTCAKKLERSSKKYRIKLIAGLVIPYFLASLDLTVVATALPFIASHFRE
jgi:hypothetical protein